LKNYANPPKNAAMAVEAVVCLLDNLSAKPTWK